MANDAQLASLTTPRSHSARSDQALGAIRYHVFVLPLQQNAMQSIIQNPKTRQVSGSPASFMRRFAAVLLDGAIIFIPLSVLLGIVAYMWAIVAGELPSRFYQTPWAGITFILILMAYEGVLASSSLQATLGKRVLGIFVTDTDGDPVSFGRASVRFLAKGLSSILFLGFAMQLFSKKGQALHDKISGCLVLSRNVKNRTA